VNTRICLITACLLAAASGSALAADCNVVTGPADITEDGRFAVPEPTAEQCDAVAALVEKFLGADPRDFRRTVEVEGIPGNVRVSIGRLYPWGRPGPIGSIEGDLPNQRHVVTWRMDNLTVVVYQTDDFLGTASTVLIADQEGFRVCKFPRWPFEGDPRRISIDDIQRALRDGLAADASFAACRLEVLSLD